MTSHLYNYLNIKLCILSLKIFWKQSSFLSLNPMLLPYHLMLDWFLFLCCNVFLSSHSLSLQSILLHCLQYSKPTGWTEFPSGLHLTYTKFLFKFQRMTLKKVFLDLHFLEKLVLTISVLFWDWTLQVKDLKLIWLVQTRSGLLTFAEMWIHIQVRFAWGNIESTGPG